MLPRTPAPIGVIANAAAAGKWRGAAPSTYARNLLAEQQEQKENEQFADLIRFAAFTGLRRGEIVAVSRADIKWAVPMVAVSRAQSADVIKRAKSGKTREVPLSGRAVAALKRIESRPTSRLHTAATWFVRQMDPRDVQKIIGPANLKTSEALPSGRGELRRCSTT